MAARNPAEVQVDLLLEAQRTVGKRLTALEQAVEHVADAVSTQGATVQRSLRVLQAEIDLLKQTVFRTPAPRRCPHCFLVVAVDVTECPSCTWPL
jgi:hypothetical protein